MRKITATLALATFAALASSAHAQSSVTLFGLVDGGISYVSNEGGHRNFKFDDGIYTPNLFGLRGVEDLGGGNRAVFALVNQFALGNGQIIGNGLFSRYAYVGLENDTLGHLTFGRQYDFMVDSLFFGGDEIAMDLTGLYGFRSGPFQKLDLPQNPTGAFDWDRLAGAQAINNSVKYTSPTIHGLSGGVMYAFGNVAGSVGADNAVSAGLNYQNGPFGAGAAYTSQKFGADAGLPATTVRNWGAGAHYALGDFTGKVLLTTVHNSFNDASVWAAEVGGIYRLTPAWSAGASYTYMKGNAALSNNHVSQVSAALKYAFSKRTVAYVSADYQRANSGANAQINGVLDPNGASSTPTQVVARIGMQTVF